MNLKFLKQAIASFELAKLQKCIITFSRKSHRVVTIYQRGSHLMFSYLIMDFQASLVPYLGNVK